MTERFTRENTIQLFGFLYGQLDRAYEDALVAWKIKLDGLDSPEHLEQKRSLLKQYIYVLQHIDDLLEQLPEDSTARQELLNIVEILSNEASAFSESASDITPGVAKVAAFFRQLYLDLFGEP